MRQIRRNVFETNSSSTHSLTMCSKNEYEKWKNGELYLQRWGNKFKTRDEVIEILKTTTRYRSTELCYPNIDWNDTKEVDHILRKERWFTEEQYWNDVGEYQFYEDYITPNGEEIVAFGYYDYDY